MVHLESWCLITNLAWNTNGFLNLNWKVLHFKLNEQWKIIVYTRNFLHYQNLVSLSIYHWGVSNRKYAQYMHGFKSIRNYACIFLCPKAIDLSELFSILKHQLNNILKVFLEVEEKKNVIVTYICLFKKIITILQFLRYFLQFWEIFVYEIEGFWNF